MEKLKYKISSRATILLGRESVSKAEGALVELIKNTYDADAVLCYIYFNIDEDSIYIIDDGLGMTKQIIENHWMMIGTDNKKEDFVSYKNRVKSGEKGIGRFALDRLGSRCELYTKHKDEKQTIYWKTNWNNFEEAGKVLEDIEADFDYVQMQLLDVIPNCAKLEIEKLTNQIYENKNRISFDFLTGTVLKITGLRDKWSEKDITRIENSLSFLIPPEEQEEYYICIQKNKNEDAIQIENNFLEEYDYKLSVEFTGKKFIVKLDRNEFDLMKIPEDAFMEERFLHFPYRKQDFEHKVIELDYTIQELFKTDDEELVRKIKNIGSFRFKYIFMKLALQGDRQDIFFYKDISKNRAHWLQEHGGIKIYRDNFLVRPYGDSNSDAFDWLGLESRNNSNPVAVSSNSEAWTVRNAQGQGTIFISRILNDNILDKSSREGVIENESFRLLKQTIIKLISILEKDRSYIAKTFKLFDDKKFNKGKTKSEGSNLAKEILSNKGRSSQKNIKKLAKTVKYYEEEREELISELKLLRSLATNGLITTSIVHDLKSLNAILVNRVESLKMAITHNDNYLLNRNLDDLYKDDLFLKSWITVITNQNKKDKRKRLKKDMYSTIEKIVDVLEPILSQKKVSLKIIKEGAEISRKIFESDFESIMYNLIINSIEAFPKTNINQREITIVLSSVDDFIIQYKDNGNGIETFKDPYDIFKFGTTSKLDRDGNIIGTGLGMYIIASTIREYNGDYKLTETKQGFGLEIRIPL